jgi:polysaccharide biosynthesis protein PslH
MERHIRYFSGKSDHSSSAAEVLKKMRILILTTKPPWPPRDGGAVASMRIIEGLASHGAVVSVLSMTTPKHYRIKDEPSPSKSLIKYFLKAEVDTSIHPLSFLKNFFFSERPYDLERFYSGSFLEILRSITDIKDYDIIQCEGLVFAFYVNDIRALTNAKIILRAHNIEHHIKEMMAQHERNILKRLYLLNLSSRIKRTESSCRNMFDAIVAITEDDRNWFEGQDGRCPVVVSETGEYPEMQANEFHARNNNVGFIGALDWQPNIDGLLWFLDEVWPAIVKDIPAASFRIAGRNAASHTQKLLAGKNVVFLGEIDDARVFISSMAVMIAPLFAGSGMRIKIIEAMNAGIPVVASPVAAQGLPVTDNHDIIIGSDKNGFKRGVTELLTDSEMRHSIGMNGKALIREKFDNDKLTAQLLEFYKTLHDGC